MFTILCIDRSQRDLLDPRNVQPREWWGYTRVWYVSALCSDSEDINSCWIHQEGSSVRDYQWQTSWMVVAAIDQFVRHTITRRGQLLVWCGQSIRAWYFARMGNHSCLHAIRGINLFLYLLLVFLYLPLISILSCLPSHIHSPSLSFTLWHRPH